jgi:hypothetical protein
MWLVVEDAVPSEHVRLVKPWMPPYDPTCAIGGPLLCQAKSLLAERDDMSITSDSQTLLAKRQDDFDRLHLAHYRSTKYYERLSRGLGVLAIALSAAAGTTVLQGLPANAKADVVLITGLAALLAAAIAAIQTFLAYPALAERHKTAGIRYRELRDEIGRLVAFPPASSPDVERRLDEIETCSSEADRASPSIPNRIMKKYPAKVPQPG